MILSEFVTKYNGQYVRGGQCGELVRQYWIDVDKTNPPSYTNSKDYWSNPVPGYDKVSTPQPGDIAIYDGHGIYTEGHSAIVLGGTMVFEQNADPNGSPAHQFNRPNTYLLGYLHKQGGVVEPADYRVNAGDVQNYFKGMLRRDATAEDHKIYDGKTHKEITYAIMGSPEYAAVIAGNNFVPVTEQLYREKT